MGRIWCTEFISIDGVIEGADAALGARASDESNGLIERDVAESDRMLMGRVTFEELFSFWPHQPDTVPIAAVTNGARKSVASRTLTEASWGPDTRLHTDAVSAVREMRAEDVNVSIWGSSTIVRALLAHRLLDQIRLVVVPVALGTGRRLFDDSWTGDLTLAESTRLPNGIQYLVYDVDPV